MAALTFDILSKFNDAGTKKGARGFKELGRQADKSAKDASKSLGKLADGAKQSGQKAAKEAAKGLDELGDKAARSGKDSGRRFGLGFSKSVGMGSRISGMMKTSGGKVAAVAGGAAIGAGLVQGFSTALEQEDSRAKLRAQLGLSAQESARLGKVAGELYKGNYGESVGDISGVMRKVVQDTNTSVRSVNLKPITAQVMSLAGTFEQDFGQVTRAAGQLVRTGLAKDTKGALDIITVGFQKGVDKSEDFLDTLNEYGTLFRNLGLSGATATGILTQGLQAGARDADKVADALGEFNKRAVDGSETTADGFKMLGLNADTMASKIGKGGGSASKALDTVLDRLRNIEDPVKRSQAAVALFGTQAEDLGDALFAIDPSKAVGSLGKVGGAAKKLDKIVGGTTNATLKGFIRTLEQGVTDGLGSLIQGFKTGERTAEGWQGRMQTVGQGLKWIWENILHPVLQALGWAIDRVGEGMDWLGRNWTDIWTGVGQVLATVAQGILRAVQGLVDGFTWMIEKVIEAGNWIGIFSDETEADFKRWRRSVSGSFDAAVNDLEGWKTSLRNTPKIVKLEGKIDDLDRKIKDAKEQVRSVPKEKQTEFKGKIADLQKKRAAAQGEINKLKGKTVNVGVSGPGRLLNLLLSGKGGGAPFDPFGPLSGGKAAGGRIPGPRSDRDNHLRPMATGEYVVRSRRVDHKTLPILEMINQGRLPEGLAEGGVVGKVNFSGSPGLPQVGAVAREVRLAVPSLAALIGAAANKAISGMIGGVGGGSALGFARAQAGKPYVWGGVGPQGYDCSGFMSAILNTIQGRSPYSRRGSTGTFPWPGFTPGTGRFMIGHFKGNPGHMAGTLNGVNVESRGGDGVVVGGSARGALSSMFTGPYKLQGFAKGGLVGDAPYDLLDPRGKHFRKMRWFGDGGVINEPVIGVGLRTGSGYGFGERGPERVTPIGAGGGDIHVHLHGTAKQLEDQLVAKLTTLRQQGRV